MKDDSQKSNCDPTPPHARRISLKDGRYMIFFEYDATDEKPAEATVEQRSEPLTDPDV
jgi:hypothetical protein